MEEPSDKVGMMECFMRKLVRQTVGKSGEEWYRLTNDVWTWTSGTKVSEQH